jgi:hypothetical protein
MRGVAHDEEILALRRGDGVGAERNIARSFRLGEADARFEPLARLIDERDRRERRAADFRSERDEVVVSAFRCGIEDRLVAQRSQPLRFVDGER